MAEPNVQISNFSDLTLGQLDELIRVRKNTWDWVATPHSLKDTQARIRQFRELSNNISKLAHAATSYKPETPSDEIKIEAIIQRFNLLRTYERDIQDCLTQDFETQKKAGHDSKIDYIKNITFLFGLPIGFVAGVKNGAGNNHINPNDAMVFGFAISIPTVFHKMIGSFFNKAAETICSTSKTLRSVPAGIQDDMRIYYVKEIVKQKANNAHICLSTITKSINDNIRASHIYTRANLKKAFGGKEPRP